MFSEAQVHHPKDCCKLIKQADYVSLGIYLGEGCNHLHIKVAPFWIAKYTYLPPIHYIISWIPWVFLHVTDINLQSSPSVSVTNYIYFWEWVLNIPEQGSTTINPTWESERTAGQCSWKVNISNEMYPNTRWLRATEISFFFLHFIWVWA